MHTVERYARVIKIRTVPPLIFIFIFILLLLDVTAVKWLSVYRERNVLWNNTKVCKIIREQYGLTGPQTKICRKTSEAMPHVREAASLVVSSCQILFRTRRWNCSTVKLLPKLFPDLEAGTKERALVHALSTAALTYTIARGCSSSAISSCSCSMHPDEPPNGNFKWGGCGDNIQWGSYFSKQFVDSHKKSNERRKNAKTHKSLDFRVTDKEKRVKDDDSDGSDISASLLAQINDHNGEIGRKVVSNSLITHCKCHGVSGSCSIKTCWRGLPLKFHEIGGKVVSAYNTAIQVHKLTRPHLISRFSEEQLLLYTTDSPNYCEYNPSGGTFGTSGRECNASSEAPENCDSMCCGRGYKSLVVEYNERCNCKYFWCCYVKCDTCRNSKKVDICN